MSDATRAKVIETIEATLREGGIEFERLADNAFAASLPGVARLRTVCALTVGDQVVSIEAFVVRHPDENEERVYRWMLQRNPRMYAVSWSIDDSGDIYLTGKLALGAVDADEIDRVLGSVLEYADGSFNYLLQLGFATSIRREWAWRSKNGESLANLAAFADFAQRADPAD
jgi:Putative bacterial sensory transduction regulator